MFDQMDNAPNHGSHTAGRDGCALDAVLDAKVLAQIQALGDESFLAELSAIYIDDAGRLLATLDRALVREDGEALRQAAHLFKSGSYNIGAKGIADLCQQLEQFCRTGELVPAARLLGQLKREYQRVYSALTHENQQRWGDAAAA